MFINEEDTINIIYWTFVKYKRVVHSILTIELYTMVHDFDLTITIKAAIDTILG